MNAIIYDYATKNNNIITTADVIRLGFSKAVLSKYVSKGLLQRVRQGIYILNDAVHDDMYTLILRSDNIIFSHESALFLHGFSNRTPFLHSVTIPTNTSLPRSLTNECNCFYVKPDLHKLGLCFTKTTFGNTVRCYDIERTLCDLLRSRGRMDEEIVVEAFKNYAKFTQKDIMKLSRYGEYFKVTKRIRTYMEVLL